MTTQIHLIANQKGGVGKSTLAVQLAATVHEVLTGGARLDDTDASQADADSPVFLADTDPQQSAIWWLKRVEKNLGVPFDFAEVEDPSDLKKLRRLGKAHVFVDSPGSIVDEDLLLACIEEADDVLVPLVTDGLAFDPTTRFIKQILEPSGLPYRVVVNNWDASKGKPDLIGTAKFIRARGWPMASTVVRAYRVHARAAADGLVVTQYPKNRTSMEAREDFLRLALECGYGGTSATMLPTQQAEVASLLTEVS